MEQQYSPKQNECMELDLVDIACMLLRKWKWIVLSTVVCALLAVGVVVMQQGSAEQAVVVEQAVSSSIASTSVYYLETYTELSMSFQHSMEAYLAGDLQAFALSRTVLEGVIDDLGLALSYEELLEQVSASVVANTHILTITAEGADAQQAQDIAEALQVRFCDYVVQVMGFSAPVVLEGVTVVDAITDADADEVVVDASNTAMMNIIKGVVIGALLGFALSVSCVLVCPAIFDFVKRICKSMKKEA